MNNSFLKALLIWISISISSLAFAGELEFTEGKHYLRLPDGLLENDLIENFRKSEPGRIQVLEFFSYGCSWCFRLEPYIKKWEENKPNYIAFHRVPVEFQPSWVTLTKAFYTAQDLGALETIHEPLFEAIHTDAIKSSSEPALRAFFTSKGVNGDSFEQTFSSFNIDRMQKWANGISQAYKITAIPSVVVQGPEGAFLTSTRMAQGEENLLKVIDFLAKRQYDVINPND
jgi:thiol:disulfide interchange protein DsbA